MGHLATHLILLLAVMLAAWFGRPYGLVASVAAFALLATRKWLGDDALAWLDCFVFLAVGLVACLLVPPRRAASQHAQPSNSLSISPSVPAQPQAVDSSESEVVRLQTMELQNRLAAIVESSEDAIVGKSLTGVINSWNAGAERLFGYSAAEAVGQNIAMLIPPERQHEEREIIDRISRGERFPSMETIRQSKSGAPINVSIAVSPVRNAQGEIVGASKIARDITLQRRAQAAARQASERFEALVQASAQIVWTTEPDGTISEDSPSWRAFTGQTVEQWLGRQSVDAVHPDDRDAVWAAWTDALSRQTRFEMEFRLRNAAADEYRWVLTRAVPLLSADGSIRSWVGMNTDITDRKADQLSLLRAKEAAEAASRAKDHFLAVVSHELRTPLTPVLAAASHLQHRTDLPADVYEEIAMIGRNIHLEARLVDDLLSLTRLTKGKIMLHQETINAHALIRTVLAQFQPAIDAKQIELTVGLRAKESLIWADATRFQQIMGNLLSNSIKFTPESGAMTVRTSLHDDQFSINVVDSGIGIEPHVLARLFTPFEQGEQTITRKFGGLGLGLTIARQLVELHGGKLEAQSDGHGKGATFTITFKAAPAPPPDRALNVDRLNPCGEKSLRVLVVEDHPDTLRTMERLLKSLGYSVATAASVAQALERTTDQNFDLLLSDIGLPDGSGLDVVRELSQRNAIRYAIAISGFGQPEDIARSREAGFADHLVKPIDFTTLCDTLAVAATKLVA